MKGDIYKIVSSVDIKTVEKDVSKLLKEYWVLTGPLVVTDLDGKPFYSQSLTIPMHLKLRGEPQIPMGMPPNIEPVSLD